MRSINSSILTSAIGAALSFALCAPPALAKNCRDDSQCSDTEVCRPSKAARGGKACTQVAEGGGIGTRQAATGAAGVGEKCGQAAMPVSCQPGLVCVKAPATAEAGACQRPGGQ